MVINEESIHERLHHQVDISISNPLQNLARPFKLFIRVVNDACCNDKNGDYYFNDGFKPESQRSHRELSL